MDVIDHQRPWLVGYVTIEGLVRVTSVIWEDEIEEKLENSSSSRLAPPPVGVAAATSSAAAAASGLPATTKDLTLLDFQRYVSLAYFGRYYFSF